MYRVAERPRDEHTHKTQDLRGPQGLALDLSVQSLLIGALGVVQQRTHASEGSEKEGSQILSRAFAVL